MVIRLFTRAAVAALAVLLLLTARTTGESMAQAPGVEAMYADAVAKETAVRKSLGVDQPSPTVLRAVRTVVRDFESLVRLYPTSGYGDDALWRAGLTSLEAFNKLGDPQDRDAAVRLLRMLASQYPSSKLAQHVPEIVATIGVPKANSSPPAVAVAPVPQASPAALPPVTPAAASSPAAALPPGVPSPGAPPSAALSIIKSIRRTVLPDVVRITIEMDGEVPFHDERLDNPPRVFVDLAGTRAIPALVDRTLRFDDEVDLGRQVRIGRHPNSTTRIVVDTPGSVTYSVYPLYAPYRLVIDCVRTVKSAAMPGAAVAAAVPAPAAARTAAVPPPPALPPRPVVQPRPVLQSRPIRADWTGTIAPAAPRAADVLRSALEEDASELGKTPLPAKPPERNLAGGFSIARQLGLKVSRIVIDPGHGGHDPGAAGNGISEAELVLDVALRLEKLLAKLPDTDVILTRRTDSYVALQERTAIANREGADLFLSIHANASSNGQARGIETYFLNFAQNLSAAAVAARENAASGQSMGSLPDLLKTIALNNKLDESRDLATYVQRALVDNLRGLNKTVKDLGVRQAPFVVLVGAAMPSVLAEIAFLTNSSEGKLLKQSAYRQRIAESLFNAVRHYQGSLKSVTTTAQSER